MHKKIFIIILVFIATNGICQYNSTELCESYFEDYQKLFPSQASYYGDYRYNKQYENYVSIGHINKQKALYHNYLTAAKQTLTQNNRLTNDDKLNLEILIYQLEFNLRELEFPKHLLPIDHYYNIVSVFNQLGAGYGNHPFKREQDYYDFLFRVDDFCILVDSCLANMQTGLQQNITPSYHVLLKALPQIESQIMGIDSSDCFLNVLRNFPEEINQKSREKIREVYAIAYNAKFRQACMRLFNYTRNVYIGYSRKDNPGLGYLPNGKEWYTFLVEKYTTTKISPDSVYKLGLSEVKRIKQEMLNVKNKAGFKDSLPVFLNYLRNDKKFYFIDKQELLATYDLHKKNIFTLLTKYFNALPKADYMIKPIEAFREKSKAAAQYIGSSPDGSRPAIFYVNTYNLPARPKYNTLILSLHEAMPGHHLQFGLQYENTLLPKFRRYGDFIAYTEGWGLYAEDLGAEMGLFKDPYDLFGKLSAEMWRACRLVVDVGIHFYGWKREDAISYLLNNTALSKTEAEAEVDRYIAVPGQALAYKIGELKILELRKKAKRSLKGTFDIKEFHQFILSLGSVPLAVLEKQVEEWIVNKQK